MVEKRRAMTIILAKRVTHVLYVAGLKAKATAFKLKQKQQTECLNFHSCKKSVVRSCLNEQKSMFKSLDSRVV